MGHVGAAVWWGLTCEPFVTLGKWGLPIFLWQATTNVIAQVRGCLFRVWAVGCLGVVVRGRGGGVFRVWGLGFRPVFLVAGGWMCMAQVGVCLFLW